MGTNFYARIIPTHERKEALKKMIDENRFTDITHEVDELYRSFNPYNKDDKPIGEIHLGKRSGGWKFLWNPNVYPLRNGHSESYTDTDGRTHTEWIWEPDTAYYVYPLTKEGIKAFIDREDVEVYDEYGEKQDKDTFFKEALEWTKWHGEEAYDSATYAKAHPDERHWNNDTELTRLLEREGFEFTTPWKYDFYSDGLRFSSSNEFG